MPTYPYSFTLPPVNKQDIPNDGVAGEFLGINGSGQLDWLTAGGGGTGDMLKADNLSGLASYPTARTNLGLGTGDSPTFANLTLTSPSLSSSAPVTISQTWNNAAVAFTGLKVVATDTASGAASNLLELWSGNAATLKLSIRKSGQIVGPSGTIAAPTYGFADTDWGTGFSGWYRLGTGVACSTAGGTVSAFSITHTNIRIGASIPFGWTSNTAENALDTILLRDGAANTLALRNSTAAQTFRVYKTYSNAGADYERLSISHDGVQFGIGSERGGSGVAQPLRIYGGSNAALDFANGVSFRNASGGTTFMTVASTGNVGIGTTAPTSGLHISGALGTDGGTYNSAAAIKLTNTTVNSSWLLTSGVVGVANAHFCIRRESVSPPALTIAGITDNVGIGTTSPAAKLQIGTHTGTVPSGTVVAVVGAVPRISFSSNDDSVNYGGYILSNYSGGTFMTLGTRDSNVDTAGLTLKGGNVGIGTTAPSSKLHVVGDAVLTGDLLGTNYTIGVPTILTQSNISITNTHSGVADSSIVITPKGTGGVIFGPKPDGTSTGGNARGIYSVDLQTAAKTGPAQVASGSYSALVGGQANRASGAHSFCGGGNANTPSGTFSVTCGGQSNAASGNQSFIGGGIGNTASGTNAFIAGGVQGLADRYGITAHSSGQFGTTGDSQSSRAVFRNKTTTNSAVELFLDGASSRYTVTSGKIISMLINITGTKSDGSAVAHYVRQYSIKNIGGTTSEVYAAVTVGTDNAAGTSIALSADNTNDSLKIEVTGVTSETWRWVASVDAVEVGHGV